ncbi:telomere-binding alpha subunit central domain-containing protein [Colletotrichum truncatum]|uniref:Telomere-binding alpha subunit central domain-containing protein n=1 Tax=Colletotrichum truncatum TaxID=5467 RepID=A0ACC3ZJ86_COLTU|nr:telomere-binding alpha subunit central domain-containing protein [Colletotrichum truncatum]KAF6791960.1 telomere-binding alpha subunit central domain-containing protein [Colletotrichum truncatum]
MTETSTDKSLDLPKGFIPLKDITENVVKIKTIVSVIGLVKDFRPPISTKREDWKCMLRLYDPSILGTDVELNIFRPKDEMPNVGAGDVVVVHKANVQRYQSDPLSLTTHWGTTLHVYPAAKIPQPPQSASRPVTLAPKGMSYKATEPIPVVEEYVSWLYHTIDKDCIPSVEDFEIQAIRSLNVKNKLCELKEVKDGTFHDLIANVVQEPFDFGDKMRLYVSDYTENSGFYHYTWNGQQEQTGRDGDPYGYTLGKTRDVDTSSEWTGPFGKKTLQITCYEPHASVIRSTVKLGSWVRLLNVQIKYGSNASNLEGYLREDVRGFGHKIYVDVLDPREDPENIHPFLKNAIRRKRDYEKEKRNQIKEIRSATSTTSKKRAATDQPGERRLNAKQKRALQRAQVIEKAEKNEALAEPPLDINPQVACENQERPTHNIYDILEPPTFETTIEGGPLAFKLPFTCSQYRANVRVIDFHPPSLQDFACPLKKTESDYVALTDYSDFDSEDDDRDDQSTVDRLVDERTWEWRFALRLQDATPPMNTTKQATGEKHNTFWVLVDNQDAQLLTGLDACDLQREPEELSRLREKMFILWGDLEEKKSKKLTSNKRKKDDRRKALSDRPSLDSSDNEVAGKSADEDVREMTISNRPFTCCIRQYGVRVNESDPERADAGDGKRWQRVFGLFGTKIRGA